MTPGAADYRVVDPRDTRVRLPGFGVAKINAANVVGGPALTAQVVSQLLGGIPIDRYVRLNTEALEALIDAVGGVEVYVPEPMHYVDRTQQLFITLQPGWHRLNGKQAHHFARFRHDQLGLGDIGRVQRQQELLRALSRELLSPPSGCASQRFCRLSAPTWIPTSPGKKS